MRYRYLDDFRRGISVFAIFSYGIAVLGTPQCPPQDSKGPQTNMPKNVGFIETRSTFECFQRKRSISTFKVDPSSANNILQEQLICAENWPLDN